MIQTEGCMILYIEYKISNLTFKCAIPIKEKKLPFHLAGLPKETFCGHKAKLYGSMSSLYILHSSIGEFLCIQALSESLEHLHFFPNNPKLFSPIQPKTIC